MIIKQDIYCEPADENRTLHIWLPDDYNESDESYPVMYFFDGHNLFSDEDATYGTSWGLKEFLSQWPKDIIIVGIECSHHGRDRLKEYCPYHFNDAFFGDLHGEGAETLNWIVFYLKNYIDCTFRTWDHREATAIGGSSMGGLMSLYAVVKYNGIFSKAACVSSTVTPCREELLADIAAADLFPDTRVYLSWGENEGRGCDEKLRDDFDSYTSRCNHELAEALRPRIAAAELYFQPDGNHCEADWSKQNGRYMDFLWRS